MSIFDDIKGVTSEIIDQSKENHIKVTLVSGKKCFGLGAFENSVVIRQNDAGFIYFDEIEGEYKIASYEWGGPEYKSISKTTGSTVMNGKTHSKGKEKRTGRLAGAVIGGSLSFATGGLAAPGLVAGALLGTGKKSKGKEKTRAVETHTGQTTSYDQETDSVAYMTLKDPINQYTFTFSFKCNSRIHGEILNMLNTSALQTEV